MEWLILLLVVPAIVVPLVLLCGFAGCHFHPAPVEGGNGSGPVTVLPPTVTAEPRNVDHIFVSWQGTDPNHPAQKYHYVRIGGAPAMDVGASVTTQDDTGLDANTTYTYQVSTIAADGTSDPTSAMASTFQPAFEIAAVPTNQPNFAGDFTFVQRIGAAKLLAGGGTVGIKVRGAPASNVTINRIYISQVAAAGHPWDSAGDLTPVITSPLTLPNAQPVDLDPIAYTLDKNRDLIIAFDFTASSGADTIAYVSPLPGVTLYFKAGVQQASVQTRDPGYSTGPSQLYLTVTIGVP
jgi:hypothetical protein